MENFGDCTEKPQLSFTDKEGTAKTNVSAFGRTCSVFKNLFFVSEGHMFTYLSSFLDIADCNNRGWSNLTSPYTTANEISKLR